MGVSTQLLAGGDIYPALDLGTIDATEFAQPVIDYDLGFYQVAKHYYLPGWHQPTSFSELIVNLDRWSQLSLTQKAQIEATCAESIVRSYARSEALQPDALDKLQDKGVTIHQWPAEFLDAFEAAWFEVVEEEAANNEDFARVWASLSEFRETYRTWATAATCRRASALAAREAPGPPLSAELDGACARLESAVDSVAEAFETARGSDRRADGAAARLDRAVALLDDILGTPCG